MQNYLNFVTISGALNGFANVVEELGDGGVGPARRFGTA